MLHLIISILGSVSVGVLLKFAKSKNTNIFQMISVNYVIALILSYYFFDVDLTVVPVNFPFETIIPLAILMPTIFVALYLSISNVGIIKTDIAQRLSLFIPILAAIVLFKESISSLKYFGLAIGLISIYFTLSKASSNTLTNKAKGNWLYPLLVFIGFGVIDVFFKQLALYSEIPYTSSLFYVFSCALLVSVCINLFYIIYKKHTFNVTTLLFGIPLGILNFTNIYFYMKAHQDFASNPTTVFAGMNFGVIILGTLIGYFVFNEKLSKKNLFGLLLAIIAVSIIILTQFYG